jgi:hypothetical protein
MPDVHQIPEEYRPGVLLMAENRLRHLFPDASGVKAPGECGTCISAEAIWHGTALTVHHPRCISRGDT